MFLPDRESCWNVIAQDFLAQLDRKMTSSRKCPRYFASSSNQSIVFIIRHRIYYPTNRRECFVRGKSCAMEATKVPKLLRWRQIRIKVKNAAGEKMFYSDEMEK